MNPPPFTPNSTLSFVPSTPGAYPGTPTPRGRGAGAPAGAKRGRKPRGAGPNSASNTPRVAAQDFKVPAPPPGSGVAQAALQWPPASSAGAGPSLALPGANALQLPTSVAAAGGGNAAATAALQSRLTQLSLPATDFASTPTRPLVPGGGLPGQGPEEDGEEDELLPAMADDDYSAQLSWQSQSKDNLKVLMDNFSETQYDRFEAYRRHALPKAAVRKVIQQTLGQQVSQPVAQIVAGFSKVFVGEIVEKARAMQQRRGETGPLSPDHLREAYRVYQEETGRVGAARPLRAKRLFMR